MSNIIPFCALTCGLYPPNASIGLGSTLPINGLGVMPLGVPPNVQGTQFLSQSAVADIQAAAAAGPALGSPVTILDQNGVPINFGTNINDVGTDLITNPALMNTTTSTTSNLIDLQNNITSYTGSDLRIIVDVVDAFRPWSTNTRLTKQLVECTTISVSVHREKDAARACSFINPKGFARGKRTIAGTIVLTQSTIDTLFRFIGATLWNDTSKDSGYVKVDQLPPMDFTMVFANEMGQSSYRRLLGVDFLTDGTIYSMNDAMTEQTISYVAADFTPLLPFTLSCLSQLPLRPSASAQMTPIDVMKANAQSNQTPAYGSLGTMYEDTAG